MEEVENKLESLADLEQRLASATTELEKTKQANRELRNRVATLEYENSRLTNEVASPDSLEASVEQLNEQFNAFQQSYVCDVDKLVGLLLEVQSALVQKRNASMLHRVRLALVGNAGRRNRVKAITNVKDATQT
jgi:predicted nuclease with TOPRIM domain